MFTYKDMTFCSNKKCKNHDYCYRRLTEEIKEAARKYKIPIACSDEYKCSNFKGEDEV